MLLSKPQQIIPKLNAEAGVRSLEHDFSLQQIQLITRIDGSAPLDSLATLLRRSLHDLASDIRLLVNLGVLLLFKRDESSGSLERYILPIEEEKEVCRKPIFRDGSAMLQAVQDAVSEKEHAQGHSETHQSPFSESARHTASDCEAYSVGDEATISNLSPIDVSASHYDEYSDDLSERTVAEVPIISSNPNVRPPCFSEDDLDEATMAEIPSIAMMMLQNSLEEKENATVAEIPKVGNVYDSTEIPHELVDATMAEVQTILSSLSSGTPLPSNVDSPLGQSVRELMDFLATAKANSKESHTKNQILSTQVVRKLRTLPHKIVANLLGDDASSLDSLESSLLAAKAKKPSRRYLDNLTPKGNY